MTPQSTDRSVQRSRGARSKEEITSFVTQTEEERELARMEASLEHSEQTPTENLKSLKLATNPYNNKNIDPRILENAKKEVRKEFPNSGLVDIGTDRYGKVVIRKWQGRSKRWRNLYNQDGTVPINFSSELRNALGEPAEKIVEKNLVSIDALNETIQLDQDIIDDPDTTLEDRQAARERTQEREEEIERLEGENEVIEERMSLRDRVKTIFKKYGVTVLSVLTAAGVVIGVIVSSLQSGLTKVAKGVGNGLKALGKKLGQLLPGAIGAIVSFLFRTAGEVVGFLGKNIWLLIVGVVIFLIEQNKKR